MRAAILLAHAVHATTQGCVDWSAVNATWFGDEHEGPAQPYCLHKRCLVALNGCAVWWRTVSDDVIPPIPELTVPLPDDDSRGACRGPTRRTGHLGIANDDRFGRCTTSDKVFENGGGFEILQARRHAPSSIDCGDRRQLKTRWEALLATLRDEDYALVEAATTRPIRNVTAAFSTTASACDFAGFLSSSRLFVHALNGEGLHALRAVLAERLRDLRLSKYASGPVLDEWFESGVLIRPYTNDQDVYDLLKVVAGEPAVPAPPYDWAERRITSVENDPQGRAHVDSFASVVKVWLFDAVGADAGPLHIVRGSHRHTLDRLAWEHARANGREALVEPSFRLTSNESDSGDAAAFVARCQRDAEPIVTHTPIVVVADTSLVHFRGAGRVGAVRRSRRLRGDNGGGLVRRNPFRFVEEE